MKQHACKRKISRGLVAGALGAMLFGFPFGGCQFDQITTTSTVTLNTRDVLISMIRGAIITPIDTYVTNGVNELFDRLEDED